MNDALGPGRHPAGPGAPQGSNDPPGRLAGQTDACQMAPEAAPAAPWGAIGTGEEVQPQPGAPSALSAALARFLRRCDAESTLRAYERELLRFLAWLPKRSGADVLFDYRDALRARGLGPTTIRWRTTVARAFLQFAEAQGVAGAPPAGDFRPPRGHSGFAPRVLTRTELERLLAAPDVSGRATASSRDAREPARCRHPPQEASCASHPESGGRRTRSARS